VLIIAGPLGLATLGNLGFGLNFAICTNRCGKAVLVTATLVAEKVKENRKEICQYTEINQNTKGYYCDPTNLNPDAQWKSPMLRCVKNGSNVFNLCSPVLGHFRLCQIRPQ
jgi:hypothetical protein